MPRSVNHVASRARRKKILSLTRGNFGGRANVWTVAKNTWEKGLQYAYRDRKNKKRTFRALWIQRINAAARLEGLSYSQLMGALKKAGIEINRKVLADLAMNQPAAFKAIVEKAVQDGSMSLREFRSRVHGKWLHRDAAGSATALEISPAGRSGLLRFRFSAAGKNSEAVGAPESDRILMSYDNGARMSTGYRYGKNGNTETLTLIFENGGEYTFQKQ